MAYIDPLTRDYRQTAGHDWTPATHPLQEAVVRRLMTQRGTCFWDLSYGSTLHELVGAPARGNLTVDAEARVKAALRPLVEGGRIQSLKVSATRTTSNRLDLGLRVVASDSTILRFSTFVRLA